MKTATRRTARRLATVTATLIFMIAGSLWLAHEADASPQDDAYLEFLAEHGIYHISGNPREMIRAGYEVCSYLDQTGGDLLNAVDYVWSTSGKITIDQATSIVAAAVVSYCPEYTVTSGYAV